MIQKKVFYYEFADQSTTQEQAENFTKLVDEELKQTNIEYEAKLYKLANKVIDCCWLIDYECSHPIKTKISTIMLQDLIIYQKKHAHRTARILFCNG